MRQIRGVLSSIQIILFTGTLFTVSAHSIEDKKNVVTPVAPAPLVKNTSPVKAPEIPKEMKDKMIAEMERRQKQTPEQKKQEYIETELKLLDARYKECNLGYDLFKKNNPNGKVEDTFWYQCKKQYLEEKKKFTDMK